MKSKNDFLKVYINVYDRRKTGESAKEYHNRQHDRAKELLSFALLKETGIAINDCIIKKNQYGKPYFENHPEIHYNISHCNGAVSCVLSDHEAGIDIEDIRLYREHIIRRVCTDDEILFLEKNCFSNESFFQIWTLKEAFIKAIGKGLAFPLKEVSFRIEGKELNCHHTLEEKVTAEVYQKKLKSGYIVSICSLGGKSILPVIEMVGE